MVYKIYMMKNDNCEEIAINLKMLSNKLILYPILRFKLNNSYLYYKKKYNVYIQYK